MKGWDEDCLNEEISESLFLIGGKARTRGEYQLNRTKSGQILFYNRLDGPGLLRWWRGNGGEWIVGGPMNGTGVLFYMAAGNNSHPPSTGWTDSEGNAVGEITISSSPDLQNNTEDVFCDGMDGKLLDLGKSDHRVCDGTTWHQGGRTGTES